MTMIAIFVGIATYPVLGILDHARMRAEREKLSALAREIRSSFRNDDLANFNISAIDGDVPDDRKTLFDTTLEPVNERVTGFAWFSKLARMRAGNDVVVVNDPVGSVQGDMADILFNTCDRRRFLFRGPRENDRQRYLLVSFMIGAGIAHPALPNMPMLTESSTEAQKEEYRKWFNGMYYHDWGIADGPPSLEAAYAWGNGWLQSSGRGYSFAQRVLVERIVQPRFFLTINNQSDAHMRVYTNLKAYNEFSGGVWTTNAEPGQTLAKWPIDPARGGILEGRRVLVWRMKTEDDEEESRVELLFSFQMNETTAVTGQQRINTPAGDGEGGGG